MTRIPSEGLREKLPNEPVTRSEWNAVVRQARSPGSGLGTGGEGGAVHQPIALRPVTQAVGASPSNVSWGDWQDATPRWSVFAIRASFTPVTTRDHQEYSAWHTATLDLRRYHRQLLWVTNGDLDIPAMSMFAPERLSVIPILSGAIYRLRVTPTTADQPAANTRATPTEERYLTRAPRDGEFVRISPIYDEDDAGPTAWFRFWPRGPRTRSYTFGSSVLAGESGTPARMFWSNFALLNTKGDSGGPFALANPSPDDKFLLTEEGIYTITADLEVSSEIAADSYETVHIRLQGEDSFIDTMNLNRTAIIPLINPTTASRLVTGGRSISEAVRVNEAPAEIWVDAARQRVGQPVANTFASLTIQYHGRRESL